VPVNTWESTHQLLAESHKAAAALQNKVSAAAAVQGPGSHQANTDLVQGWTQVQAAPTLALAAVAVGAVPGSGCGCAAAAAAEPCPSLQSSVAGRAWQQPANLALAEEACQAHLLAAAAAAGAQQLV